MANGKRQWRRILVWLGLAAALTFSPALAAGALSTATVSLTIAPAGPLRAAISMELPFRPVTQAPDDETDSGTLRLTVSDARGNSDGWAVVLSATDFVYLGDAGGRDLPNTGFRIVSVGDPDLIAGVPRGDGGPRAANLIGAAASLDRAWRVLWADPGWGSGDYAQRLAMALTIPAGSRPGRYVSVLTVAIVSGP